MAFCLRTLGDANSGPTLAGGASAAYLSALLGASSTLMWWLLMSPSAPLIRTRVAVIESPALLRLPRPNRVHLHQQQQSSPLTPAPSLPSSIPALFLPHPSCFRPAALTWPLRWRSLPQVRAGGSHLECAAAHFEGGLAMAVKSFTNICDAITHNYE